MSEITTLDTIFEIKAAIKSVKSYISDKNHAFYEDRVRIINHLESKLKELEEKGNSNE